MYRKHFTLIFAAVLLISMIGCGFKNIMPSKEVPPLEGYSSVVLAPFDLKGALKEYADLPTLLSYSIGTKLSVRYQDRSWLFDQSQTVAPVSAKLKELNIDPKALYIDSQKAIKLAESLQADLIIVGQMEKPGFTKEQSSKIEEEKSKVTPTGAAKYYAIYQTAILRADVKVIDVKSGKAIWDGRIIGYKKYKTRYRTLEGQKSEREETMYSDVRKDFMEKFVEKLYPAKVAEGK